MTLRKTKLDQVHRELGAKMVPFAGFEMPVCYTTVNEEHNAVRHHVGLFDLCHMGRITISGSDASSFLDYLVSSDIAQMKPSMARYGLLLNEKGLILDDIITYCREESYLVVCNGANLEKVLGWLGENSSSYDVQISDDSEKIAMLAIQGSQALDVMKELTTEDLSVMKYYSCLETEILGKSTLIARTGYTGEDGFELYFDMIDVIKIWNQILSLGFHHDLVPIGLAARDTLRLEAGMPLYGHEINEQTHPFQANLSFAVKLKKENFMGKKALLRIKEEGFSKKLACLEVKSKRIARSGCKVYLSEKEEDIEVGEVTSGTLSPTLGKSIALAYIPVERASLGSRLNVKIGKNFYPVEVVSSPFYSRVR